MKEQEGGKSYDVIPTISLFRPDGTLAASADYDHRGRVTEWGTFDKTGKVFVTKVIMQNQGADPPAPPTIRQVIFFDEKKNQRIWQTDKQNVVSLELGRDPVGGSVKILHRAPRPRGSATTRTTTRATSG